MLALSPPGRSGPASRIEADLTGIAQAVSIDLGPRLRALLLLGSYGRGDGGLVERDGEFGPFNDYDLVAVVDRIRPALRRRLATLRATLSRHLGVDVDIYPIEVRRLARPPRTLLWLDAALGAVRVLHGDASVLDGVQSLTTRGIPLAECGRLLANRAAGLALSNLETYPERGWRAARHAHKAVLACGDVLLLAADRYPGSLTDRVAMLESLAGAPAVGPALVSAYREAVAFRERPDRWSPGSGDFGSWYRRTCGAVADWHLAFEAWRVGAPPTAAAFVAFPGRLYPDADDLRPSLAWLSHLRSSARGASPLRPYLGHPRERLARVAVALAYGSHDPACRTLAAGLLGEQETSDAILLPRLTKLIEAAA